MPESIRVLGDNICFRKWEPPARKSGLVLPEGAQLEDLPRGEIIAVGPDVETVKVGDVVFFGTLGAFSPAKINHDQYLICTEKDVKAIVENPGDVPEESPIVRLDGGGSLAGS